VIVNRVWKQHFGTGLVDTPSNFGVSGERPTNPALLEHLASGFVKGGMSMKKLHREILLSAAYQLSTADDAAALAKDSGNRFYWRANRKRLDAEQLRDSILFVAGNLDKSLGGPSADLAPSMLRRTVYGKVSRFKPDEYLTLFDFPSPLISAEKRFVTTVPAQRLFLMNSDFMQVEAEELAKLVASAPTNRERIQKAYRLIHGRAATEKEVALGLEYLKAEPMLEYEEQKKKAAEKEAEKAKEGEGRKGKPGMGGKPEMSEAPDASEAVPAVNAGEGMMGMGMMGGMGGFGGGRGRMAPPPPPVKYEATPWGRYAKVLLSSSEFLFVN
jgi:hypothetical protein